MICQNCRTEVDDDLIFCTNCGARLFERKTEEPTVFLKEPVYTAPDKTKPRKSSNLKWVALIIALAAIPASIFGVYLLMSAQRNPPVTQNVNKPKTPTATPTRKANSNQNSNVNVNSNPEKSNSNAETNSAKTPNKTGIMNERLEIAPKSHETVPFEVKTETARITGKVTILKGDKIEGFVYLKKSYDEHFPDENFKMFSFGSAFEVRQTLVEENYVLVFVNNGEEPVVLQGNFSLEN